jgi:dihydrofolate reductase
MDEKRGIGKDGKLPWRLSSDMKRFRELTMGHHVVVGRKTIESIGKPLPGRQTIVVTRNSDYKIEGCLIAGSVQAAIALAEARGEKETFVIGGADIYAEALVVADRVYLTEVHAEVGADTFFPEFDRSAWAERECSFQPADEKNEHACTFRLLERVRR